MTEPKANQATTYPLPAYNFRVTIDGQSLGFAEVSGLELEYETVTYRHGLSFLVGEGISRFRHDKYVPVTFKRGTRKGGDVLARWFGARKPRVIEVSLCDEAGVPSITWRIRRAVPIKLVAPTLDATSNEAAVESLEVMAAGITVEYHT